MIDMFSFTTGVRKNHHIYRIQLYYKPALTSVTTAQKKNTLEPDKIVRLSLPPSK